MTWQELLSDWRFWLATILAIIFGILDVILGRWGRKLQKMNLIPDCTLRIESTVPGQRQGTGQFNFINRVAFYRDGGIVKYPIFHHILLLRNPFEIGSATTKIIQGTPMISGSRGGPWLIGIPITQQQLERIDCIYMALECKDRDEKDYFTIAMFEYILRRWEIKRSVYKTKRKRFWNKHIIKIFQNEPAKWVGKYGKRGKLINE